MPALAGCCILVCHLQSIHSSLSYGKAEAPHNNRYGGRLTRERAISISPLGAKSSNGSSQ